VLLHKYRPAPPRQVLQHTVLLGWVEINSPRRVTAVNIAGYTARWVFIVASCIHAAASPAPRRTDTPYVASHRTGLSAYVDVNGALDNDVKPLRHVVLAKDRVPDGIRLDREL
jgi:hypothetical protein